jgi:hypothetical protein
MQILDIRSSASSPRSRRLGGAGCSDGVPLPGVVVGGAVRNALMGLGQPQDVEQELSAADVDRLATRDRISIEEIGIQGRRTFVDAGGEAFTLIPCLNDDPRWVSLVAGWCHDPLPESDIDR